MQGMEEGPFLKDRTTRVEKIDDEDGLTDVG